MSQRVQNRRFRRLRGPFVTFLAYTMFVGAGCAVLLSEAAPTAQPTPAGALSADWRVLVFSKTTGFRHDSIADGITALQELGASNGFDVDATEDAERFTDAGLAPYRVVVFLNTTGDVLNDAQQAAFERFIQAGNGFVGVHSASDTEYEWEWYGGLVGAYFANHPAIQPAALDIVRADHPATADLPARWERTDEWYNFRTLPAESVEILITIDETTYSGGTMGAGHPISWYHTYDGGRAFYTAMGHTRATYAEPLFRAHLAGAVQWAAGQSDPPAALDKRVVLPLLGS